MRMEGEEYVVRTATMMLRFNMCKQKGMPVRPPSVANTRRRIRAQHARHSSTSRSNGCARPKMAPSRDKRRLRVVDASS